MHANTHTHKPTHTPTYFHGPMRHVDRMGKGGDTGFLNEVKGLFLS